MQGVSTLTVAMLFSMAAVGLSATKIGLVMETDASSFYVFSGATLFMQSKNALGAHEYYQIGLVPRDFFTAASGDKENRIKETDPNTIEWTQTECVQGASFTDACTDTTTTKRFTFTRPVSGGGTATLIYTFTAPTSDLTRALPGGGTFTVKKGELKIDVQVKFPVGNSASDSLWTQFTAPYKIPKTFREVLASNAKVANVQAYKDAAKFVKDSNGCTTDIDIDAIFKLESKFATSYSADGNAAVVCPNAENNAANNVVDIEIEWKTIGAGSGGEVTLTLDPSFKIENGSLAGGFSFLHLFIILVVVFALILFCCCRCCCKCCCSKKKIAPDEKSMA